MLAYLLGISHCPVLFNNHNNLMSRYYKLTDEEQMLRDSRFPQGHIAKELQWREPNSCVLLSKSMILTGTLHVKR